MGVNDPYDFNAVIGHPTKLKNILAFLLSQFLQL